MSALVVLLAVVGCVVVAVPVCVWAFFNHLAPWNDARRRSLDDNYFFANCASGVMTRFRRINRRLPSNPRCRLCLVPFAGMGRLLRIRPSRKNPNYCMGCFEMAPLGARDMEIGVLFADLRGFTSWCEHRSPAEVEQALNTFYSVATTAITAADGLVDKLVGDQVMGLFLPEFRSLGEETCAIMVAVAEEIVRRFGESVGAIASLPVGVGVNYGMARVGNIGAGAVKDFTAVGDEINIAARLQTSAQAGQIILSESVFERVRDRYPGAVLARLELKGKADLVVAHVIGTG